MPILLWLVGIPIPLIILILLLRWATAGLRSKRFRWFPLQRGLVDRLQWTAEPMHIGASAACCVQSTCTDRLAYLFDFPFKSRIGYQAYYADW